ncbi:MAG: DNA mismatch repair protein MutS [Lachnospiraceae bacterium]|nr:DNA mismatch repair protein MutS [Lachnospiraceae bacterium]
MDKISPMMMHYLTTKLANRNAILFYRLGDFYEMFFSDAVLVSRELELTLTGKNCGLTERAPMCGVPFHAADTYITKLVEKGYHVAICEQVEDPKEAKGIVKREVIRVVTPGTNIDMASLDEKTNHYILCLHYDAGEAGIAVCDITTGSFRVTQTTSLQNTLDEILKLSPSEVLADDAFMISGVKTDLLEKELRTPLQVLTEEYFREDTAAKVLCHKFGVSSVTALGLSAMPLAQCAAGALLQYLKETQKNDLNGITHLDVYTGGQYMLLDHSTRRSLELTSTMREKEKRGSLLWVLDKTGTAMGARMLKTFLEQPLLQKEAILARLDAVEALKDHSVDREEIREYLKPVYDLERLLTRIVYAHANPRDLLSFASSLSHLPPIRTILAPLVSEGASSLLAELLQNLDPLTDLYDLLSSSLDEDAPLTVKEGGIIKQGFDKDIDTLKSVRTEGKQWLIDLEEKEKARTGIKNLKIKYNKVFGYYLDVTNSYKDLVPADYIRKQTLTGSERYTTEELKRLEDNILHAEDKLNTLEYEVFCRVRDTIAENAERVRKTSEAIATLDALCSLALIAEQNHYVRPSFNEKGSITIKDGRHPVVEKMVTHEFVPNDTFLDSDKDMIAIITGPNMAGKSTYMRQVALICLLAQIGSFVPAAEADLCIVDRIFTRVGASDDLASGQSTFMVEMNEVANILRNATAKSLLILDEIGRGTSTFDGLSIAWAVIEHICNKKLIGAKTLFATHYHELTELEGKIKNVRNYCVAVKESGDNIIFLRKIIRGGADQSYGIQVARLAGVPSMVTDRAKEIVSTLTDNDITERMEKIDIPSEKKGSGKPRHYDEVDLKQMSFFDTLNEEDILKEIREIDISALTPLDALNTLYRMQNELNNTWSTPHGNA